MTENSTAAKADTLALWNRVEKTDPEQTRAITGKNYKGTSPRPHYLVWRATETFGPCGIGWGFKILSERIEAGAGHDRVHIARVQVWYVWDGQHGQVEHVGETMFSGLRRDGTPYTDEDAPKKSVTDALIKALSMIGFAGDVFMGRFDDSKYVSELRDEFKQPNGEATRQPDSAPSRSVTNGRHNVNTMTGEVLISEQQRNELKELLDKLPKADFNRFLSAVGVKTLPDIPVTKFHAAKAKLKNKINEMGEARV